MKAPWPLSQQPRLGEEVFRKLYLILTLDCDDASQLMSDALDRRLAWYETWALRAHVTLCWSCRQFRRHLQFLRKACQQLTTRGSENGAAEPLQFSDQAKQHLKKLLENQASQKTLE